MGFIRSSAVWHVFLRFSIKTDMKKAYLTLTAAFLSLLVFAQEADKKIDVNINTNGNGNWYTSPWVWVVGAAVFILLLVALTRGGRRAD